MLSREERARQFLPFDALKGFADTLREKETEYVAKIELCEEQIEEISDKLKLITFGSQIEVVYYFNRQYFKLSGVVTQIDTIMKQLKIDEIKINFVDIFKLELL